MGDYNGVTSKALHSPPSSPTRKNSKRKEDQLVTPPKPNTPQLSGSKRPRTGSSSGLKSVDGKKEEFGEGGSRSVPLEFDGLMANMEQMVKMLRRVSGMKGLMSDPVMACFLSAQTVIVACTAEIISRTAPPDHQNKGSSTNTAAIANGAVHKKMKKSEPKN